MSYRRLTPKEIEDLRAEMRDAGHWMKAEMARRRRERAETEASPPGAGSTESVQSPSPMSNGEASGSALGDEQV
ncbi:hypothetical protein HNO53_05625 [Billgrantia antri]|uniref:Uncharacterized protein n=1 Tax=Halomonas sulfidivorans TaxID=2733488 RepID=A0ABX7WCJ1_9GAMM|nr:hypothetical protein [Halomonas sulfidivorans]QTP57232.1 hypothetical protein HNO53_05625 [Halomonas sulfidivorans]